MYLKLIVFFGALLADCETARILAIFPTPSISHQVVFRPLVHELVKRGHDVTIITPDPSYLKGEAPTNLTEIDVHDISYQHWHEVMAEVKEQKDDILFQAKLFLKRFTSILDVQFENPEVKELLKKDKKYFDLIFIEACIRTAMGISNVFDAPIIQFSSFGTVPAQYGIYGAPIHPLLYPTPGSQRLYDLSLWEKALELFKHAVIVYLIYESREYDNHIMRKHFGEDTPPLSDLRNRTKMLFVNEHPIWGHNRPIPPNIKYVGGIHLQPETKLPEDIQTYLDNSKYGVIYVSFGTNVEPSSLPAGQIEMMNRVFSELPYDILFKWDSDIMPKQSKNVKIFKWLSQPDILKHPNVKLFITQGGLQSTDEAIDAAIPVIGIPIFGDQWYNAEKYPHHKIGKKLQIDTVTETEFKDAVETVITDKRYKANMLRLRTLMREAPVKPLDLAVWWTEHIIKHGGDHLQAPSFNMSWIEYYEIKLVSIVLGILFVIFIVLGLITRSTVRFAYILCKKILSLRFYTNVKLKVQ